VVCRGDGRHIHFPFLQTRFQTTDRRSYVDPNLMRSAIVLGGFMAFLLEVSHAFTRPAPVHMSIGHAAPCTCHFLEGRFVVEENGGRVLGVTPDRSFCKFLHIPLINENKAWCAFLCLSNAPSIKYKHINLGVGDADSLYFHFLRPPFQPTPRTPSGRLSTSPCLPIARRYLPFPYHPRTHFDYPMLWFFTFLFYLSSTA